MKEVIFFFLFVSILLSSQGWNSSIQTHTKKKEDGIAGTLSFKKKRWAQKRMKVGHAKKLRDNKEPDIKKFNSSSHSSSLIKNMNLVFFFLKY
jgi:hypothetical protein